MVRFTFEPGTRLRDGIRLQLRRQLRGAVRALLVKDVSAESIHRARRCLKRARAIISLLTYSETSRSWKAEGRAVRDAARALAGARDLKAKLDALSRLETWAADADLAPTFARVRQILMRRRKAQEARVEGAGGADVAASLEAVGARITRKRLGAVDDREVLGGAVATYRRARRAMRVACREGADETFHEWRKHVQRHWRHMQLFVEAWPDEMQVRIGAARQISQMLGEDHDLHMLEAFLGTEKLPVARSKSDRLRSLCADMQKELKAGALASGARLFAEPSAAFGRRLGRYWSQAVKRARSGKSAPVASPELAGAQAAPSAPPSAAVQAPEA